MPSLSPSSSATRRGSFYVPTSSRRPGTTKRDQRVPSAAPSQVFDLSSVLANAKNADWIQQMTRLSDLFGQSAQSAPPAAPAGGGTQSIPNSWWLSTMSTQPQNYMSWNDVRATPASNPELNQYWTDWMGANTPNQTAQLGQYLYQNPLVYNNGTNQSYLDWRTMVDTQSGYKYWLDKAQQSSFPDPTRYDLRAQYVGPDQSVSTAAFAPANVPYDVWRGIKNASWNYTPGGELPVDNVLNPNTWYNYSSGGPFAPTPPA